MGVLRAETDVESQAKAPRKRTSSLTHVGKGRLLARARARIDEQCDTVIANSSAQYPASAFGECNAGALERISLQEILHRIRVVLAPAAWADHAASLRAW